MGIYIHIPFCVQKCNYCDFLSFETEATNALPTPCNESGHVGAARETFDYVGHVSALIHEIQTTKLPQVIDTIYIGGGTPTALPSSLLCKILDAVTEHVGHALQPDAEITVEANPGTLTREYLTALKSHGVTRLSMGLQTTKPRLLKALGRIHTMDEFLENFHTAREVGFDNINVDLMFALPGQNLTDWQETLDEVIALSPEHISAYSLTPAENTPLWDDLENRKITLPDDTTDRKMYHLAREMLATAGYIHYELSNFAKPGFESRHNVNCWRRVPYIGFGLGAHSFDGYKRWSNTEDMGEYLKMHRSYEDMTLVGAACGCQQDCTMQEHLSEKDHLAETMILGLRLTQGVPEAAVPSIYNEEVATLIKKGLLTCKDGHVCLTPLGMDLANQVFAAFI